MEDQSSHFDKIYLPSILLADMYSRTLVAMEDVEPNEIYAPRQAVSLPTQTVAPNNIAGKPTDTKPLAKPIAPEAVVKPAVILPPMPPAASRIYQQEVISTPVASTDITWLGAFNKKVLILVNDSHAVHLAENELALLTKMMEAVKLSMGDVAVVNTARHTMQLNAIMQKLPADVVIFFGVEPFSMGMPMKFPHFQLQRWNEGIYLYSPSLLQINTPSAEQVNQKKGLWKALQEIFAGK